MIKREKVPIYVSEKSDLAVGGTRTTVTTDDASPEAIEAIKTMLANAADNGRKTLETIIEKMAPLAADGTTSRKRRSKAGNITAEILKKKAELTHIKIVAGGKKLLIAGKEKHEITAILAKRHGLGQKRTREILQERGVLKKREVR